MTRPSVFLLVGTTASGKHRIAMELASRLGAEILSLDSMKVFRGMDIGTAKPTESSQRRIPHHLLDLIEVDHDFSVGDYLKIALEKVQEILERGRTPLFVGGTGLYCNALTRGLFEGPPRDAKLRQRLRGEGSTVELHERLSVIDPERARALHPNDEQRIVRALEVYASTGVPMSDLIRRSPHQALEQPHRVIYLEREPADTAERIASRTDRLFDRGFIAEVRNLHRDPLRFPGPQARGAVGYPEVLAHLEGTTSLQACIEAINHSTRRLARRQRTWFRNATGVRVVRLSKLDTPADTASILARQFEEGDLDDQ